MRGRVLFYMAGAVKTLTFTERQTGIAPCGVVFLHTDLGPVRAEYLSGSELKVDTGWSYQFLIQEEDLNGGQLLTDIQNCNIVDPFWECNDCCGDDEDEDDCEAVRRIGCFDNIEIIEELGDNDFVAILRHNEECDVYCLAAMNPYDFVAAGLTPP